MTVAKIRTIIENSSNQGIQWTKLEHFKLQISQYKKYILKGRRILLKVSNYLFEKSKLICCSLTMKHYEVPICLYRIVTRNFQTNV